MMPSDPCHKKVVVLYCSRQDFGSLVQLVLKSNVNLHLAKVQHYYLPQILISIHLVEGNWEGLPQMRNQSPISATDATNIAITGKGIIDGNGDAWRMVKKDKLTETNGKN